MEIPWQYKKYRLGGLATLYRGSDRAPDDVFATGFPMRGTNDSIVNHVLGKGNSAWWSTSINRFSCVEFGRYVYKIRGLNDRAIVANEAYLADKNTKDVTKIPFVEQLEMSVYKIIPNTNIFGVYDRDDGYNFTVSPFIDARQNYEVWGEDPGFRPYNLALDN